MISLKLLGGLSLQSSDVSLSGRVNQRRRLALLAVLAAEGRAVSRDKLVGLFWPEVDEEKARHLLADSLYVLRSGSGEDTIVTEGDDVSLNEAAWECDLWDFRKLLRDGDAEQAVALYAGPFLDGFLISDAPEFERWTEGTRSRVAREHADALEQLANEASARGDTAMAARWWRTLASVDVVSSRIALNYMRALARTGDRAAALQFARVHEEIVRAELDSPPDAAIMAFASELRAGVGSSSSSSAPKQETRTEPYIPEALPSVSPSEAEAMAKNNGRASRSSSGARLTLFVLLLVLVVAAAFAWQERAARNAASKTASVSSTSIAVLPFDPISSEPEAEFVSEGITDALTGALDRVGRLRVMSTTSARAARRAGLTSNQIGDTLKVRYLVEGSVRLARDQMRISARLSDTRDGALLWSEELTSRFSPQEVVGAEETIARSIAAALNVRLTESSAQSLVSRSSPSAQAYDFYLRGRYLWNLRNPNAVRNSIGSFEKAIAADSTYAAAYAGLADAYMTMGIGNVGDYRAEDYFPRARAAAEHALGLDSTLAGAYAALGYIDVLYDHDWTSAQRRLSRALELSPSSSTTFIYRTVLFEWTGHFDEAVHEAKSAVQFDPMSAAANLELGRAFFFQRRYDDAVKSFRVALALDSMSLRGQMHMGQVREAQGRNADAIHELEGAAQRNAGSSRPLALLANAYARGGRKSDAKRVIDSLEHRARDGYVPAFDFAIVHAGLGDVSETFAWLDRSFADHSIRPYLMDPTFDLLRSDSRYRALLQRLDLPWPSEKQ